MKKIILVIGAMLISASVFAEVSALDGKSYCRTIANDGMFGQPAGESQHCISFLNGAAIDSANAAFGSPPERSSYVLKGRILSFNSVSKYVLSRDLSDIVAISGSVVEGTILTLQK